MTFIKNKKFKFLLFIIIFIQLIYISNQRLSFKIEIIRNSFLKDFGLEYIMTNDLIELKKIVNDLNLGKFNISTNLQENTFFNQRSIELLYPIKFDKNFKKIFYRVDEDIPYKCKILNKFKYLMLLQC